MLDLQVVVELVGHRRTILMHAVQQSVIEPPLEFVGVSAPLLRARSFRSGSIISPSVASRFQLITPTVCVLFIAGRQLDIGPSLGRVALRGCDFSIASEPNLLVSCMIYVQGRSKPRLIGQNIAWLVVKGTGFFPNLCYFKTSKVLVRDPRPRFSKSSSDFKLGG